MRLNSDGTHLMPAGLRSREARPTVIARLRRVRRDERGFSLVTVGFGFMGLFAASMLAIDVGMLMTARTQAQTAADAGALAGATAKPQTPATVTTAKFASHRVNIQPRLKEVAQATR
jgi:Flp pilus assembly protein TadG